MIRVGIAGAGFGRHVLFPALARVPDCQVAAIAASTPERAAQAAADLGIAMAYGDWRALIQDPGVDVVVLALPPDLQAEAARAAIAAGKPVFAEKPLAHSLAAAAEMAGLASASGLPCGMDLPFRAISAFVHARQVLRDGAVGSVRHIAVTWNVESYANLHRRVSWKTEPSRGGGTLNNFVSHVLDYLEWLNGPARTISARLFRMPGDQRETDTFNSLSIGFENGSAASVSASAAAFAGSGHRIEIYGEEGTLVISNTTSDYMRGFGLLYTTRDGRAAGPVMLEPFSQPEGTDGRILPVSRMVAGFIAAVRTGQAPDPGFADGLRNQLLLDLAARSHHEGRIVAVAELKDI